jgi:hypothetical protein
MNYFIYIDGLAVSGSHGKERIPLLDIAILTFDECHDGYRLKIQQSPQVMRKITKMCQNWTRDRGILQ